jgi:hypothetical protein
MALFKSMDQRANTARTMVPGTIVPNLIAQIEFSSIMPGNITRWGLPKDVADMQFSAEQHLAHAKRLREGEAASRNGAPARNPAI